MSFFTRRLGALEEFLLLSDLVVIAECSAEHAFAPRFDSKNVLAVGDYDASKRYSSLVLHRIADYRKGFLTALVVRSDVVGSLVVALVDLIFGHELIDVDRPCAFDFNGPSSSGSIST